MSSPQTLQRAFVVLSMLLAVATPAAAFPISQKMTVGELKATCSKVGGEFENDGLHGACTKKNCDGKGGDCRVVCEERNGTCYGSTPNALSGRQTLIGILQNGDTVLHDLAPSSPASLSSQGPGSVAPTGNTTSNPAPPLL